MSEADAGAGGGAGGFAVVVFEICSGFLYLLLELAEIPAQRDSDTPVAVFEVGRNPVVGGVNVIFEDGIFRQEVAGVDRYAKRFILQEVLTDAETIIIPAVDTFM